jgi:hypothetical protein
MKTTQDIRTLCAELGICDDRAERLLIDLNSEHNTALQLERDRVDERVWVLEDKLMEVTK